jgi:hypothetical protein
MAFCRTLDAKTRFCNSSGVEESVWNSAARYILTQDQM